MIDATNGDKWSCAFEKGKSKWHLKRISTASQSVIFASFISDASVNDFRLSLRSSENVENTKTVYNRIKDFALSCVWEGNNVVYNGSLTQLELDPWFVSKKDTIMTRGDIKVSVTHTVSPLGKSNEVSACVYIDDDGNLDNILDTLCGFAKEFTQCIKLQVFSMGQTSSESSQDALTMC